MMIYSLRANRQAVPEEMGYGGITMGLWRIKDMLVYRYSKFNNNGVEVGLGPLLAALRGSRNMNIYPRRKSSGGSLGGSWGVLGESWRLVAPTREARRGQMFFSEGCAWF